MGVAVQLAAPRLRGIMYRRHKNIDFARSMLDEFEKRRTDIVCSNCSCTCVALACVLGALSSQDTLFAEPKLPRRMRRWLANIEAKETRRPEEPRDQTRKPRPKTGDQERLGDHKTNKPGVEESRRLGGNQQPHKNWQKKKSRRPGKQETRRPRDQETRDQETRRPGDQETKRPGDQETRRPGDQETRRLGDQETRRPERGDQETRRPGDQETSRPGDLGTRQK